MKRVLLGAFLCASVLAFGSMATADEGNGLKWEKIPETETIYKAREFTQEDAQILLRIAEAEAGNQHTEGMRKVMEVVLNRVASPNYPNDIKGVVFQKNQFASVTDGRYYTVEISPQCHDALASIEKGEPIDTNIIGFERNGNDALLKYFNYAYTVGCHNFYVEKGGKK